MFEKSVALAHNSPTAVLCVFRHASRHGGTGGPIGRLAVKGEALKGHLDLILLAALEAGPTYGYSIAARVASATGGNVTLSDGTIYTALHRLEHAGLLTSRYMTSKGRRRRVYSLTDRGWQESARLRREWWDFARGLEVLLQPGR